MLSLYTWIRSLLARVNAEERGAITAEYGILFFAVAVTLFALVTPFYSALGGWLQGLISKLPT